MRPVWVGKRQGNRSPCLLKAQIFVVEGEPVTDVQIVDLSPTGARIKVDTQAHLANHFQIHIPSRLETRHCKLRWRREGLIGVEFFRSTEVAMHMDIDMLQQRVEELTARLDTGERPRAPAAASLELPTANMAMDEIEALRERIQGMERDISRLSEALQDHIADIVSQNLAARFASFDAKHVEILATLRKLIPILSRQAA